MAISTVNYVGVDKTPLVIEGHASGQNLPIAIADAKFIEIASAQFLAVENTTATSVDLVIQAGVNSTYAEAGLGQPARTIAIPGNRSSLIRLYPVYENASRQILVTAATGSTANALKVFGVQL